MEGFLSLLLSLPFTVGYLGQQRKLSTNAFVKDITTSKLFYSHNRPKCVSFRANELKRR